MTEEFSAGAVVVRTEKTGPLYLLLHYSAGHWDFPKGHVEMGETEQGAAKRETEEETGISGIKFADGFREIIEYYYRKEGKPVHKRVVYFLALTREEEVKISFEHKGHEWLPFEKAMQRVTFASSKNVLEKAHGFLAKSDRNTWL